MFVKYSPKHPHIKVVPVVDGISVSAESVILNPGTNEVSDEKWEKIKASLAAEISDGTVKPFSVGTKKNGSSAKATTLRDVPALVAAKIIGGCSNKDTLRSWFKESLSDDLALLVVRRMRQLDMDIDEMTESDELGDGEIIDESSTATGIDGGDETGGEAKAPASAPAASGYDGMSYNELKACAKEKGIDPQQKKEALLAALKGEVGETEDGDENAGAESVGDESIPDFDDPNTKVS